MIASLRVQGPRLDIPLHTNDLPHFHCLVRLFICVLAVLCNKRLLNCIQARSQIHLSKTSGTMQTVAQSRLVCSLTHITAPHASRHSMSFDPGLAHAPPLCPRRLSTHLRETRHTQHPIKAVSESAAFTNDITGAASSVSWSLDGPSTGANIPPKAKLVVVVPSEGCSPLGVSWQKVMLQMARKLAWADPGFQLQV